MTATLENATTDDLLAFLRSDVPVPKRANIPANSKRVVQGGQICKPSFTKPRTANPAKLRDLAERLESEVEDKRRPMTQNPTPKRNREYASRLIDGGQLDRARQALLALAASIERGDLPDVLADVKTKAQILPMVRTRLDCSGGYYSVYDTGEYHDKSAAAMALRQLSGLEAATPTDSADLERREIAMLNMPGFWPTPDDICEQMAELAGIGGDHDVLEPSCGWGSIADAIQRRRPRRLDCVEYSPRLAELAGKAHAVANESIFDWPEVSGGRRYDRILMNPPFEKGQDIEHVRFCFERLLKSGGRMVAIVSRGCTFRSDRAAIAFRELVEELGGDLSNLPDDAFDRPGQLKRTKIAACRVILDKPEAAAAIEPIEVRQRSQAMLF